MGAYEIQNLKVIFVGCARDCAPFIQKSLDNIKYYSSFFKESFKIIVAPLIIFSPFLSD